MEGEVLKGHLDMIVLAALAGGPAHGYAVIQEINRRSGGTFDLPEGTIYPVLHRLEKNGLLSSRWTIADSGRKRRTYTLTRRGRSALADQRAMWERFAGAISGLFGETYRCACRKSNPHILVMQPAQDRTAKNVSGPLNGARYRRILI